jgi:hypothetical protein
MWDPAAASRKDDLYNLSFVYTNLSLYDEA